MVKSKRLDAPFVSSVQRRNERERKRVHQVNQGFASLRERLPDAIANRKMSKVETLRSAIDYIVQLQKVLVVQRRQHHCRQQKSHTQQHGRHQQQQQQQKCQINLNTHEVLELQYQLRQDVDDSLDQNVSETSPDIFSCIRQDLDDSDENRFSGRIVPWSSGSSDQDTEDNLEHHRALDSSFDEFAVPFTIQRAA